MSDSAPIHEEFVPDRRGPVARLVGRLRHRHRASRMTWTLDDSPWFADPNALEFCECGASRRLWGNWPWRRSEEA